MRAVGSLPVMFTLLNELYPTEIRTQSIAINDTIGQWFLTFYCKKSLSKKAMSIGFFFVANS